MELEELTMATKEMLKAVKENNKSECLIEYDRILN
jgi:hypothetical protein